MTIKCCKNPFLICILMMGCYSQEDQQPNSNVELKIDQIANDYFKPDEPGAAIIISKDGQTLYKKAFGMASLELNVKINPDMIFRIGSMTKQFTAVAILLLEEQGKLKTSDRIRKHLPNYPALGADIKIEHLLSHTSGIPDFTKLTKNPQAEQITNLTTADKMAMFENKALNFQPGERMSYSNSGYTVLGAIIESVSGEIYEDFIEEHIFKHLQMNGSAYDHPEEVLEGKILGYDKVNERYIRSPYFAMQLSYAAGGLRSNIEDLSVWNNALQAGRIISKSSLEKALQPFILNDGTTSNYGYGWSIHSFLGDTAYAHGGSISGFRSSGYYFPHSGYYIAILSNNTALDPEYVTFLMAATLLDKEIAPELKGAGIKKEEFVGTYQSRNTNIEIREDINGLYFYSQRIEGKLIQTAVDNFYLDNTIFACTFERNELNQVISISISHRFLEKEWFTAKRQP